MRIAYLINTYPTNSQTFIRREIQALEALGMKIDRFSVRASSERLADEATQHERVLTRYILSGRMAALVGCYLAELVTNPVGSLRAIFCWFHIVRNAGGDFIRHVAYLLEAATLKRWTMAEGINHVHAHFSNNPATVALLCQQMGGPQFSLTAHGPDELENWRSASLGEKVAAAKFVIAISHYCRAQLARAGGMKYWDKLHVVGCGIDGQEFPLGNAEFENNLTFVCVGRLCPQKAQTLLVEAVRYVARSYPDVKVIMIGDGETRQEIEDSISAFGLERNFNMLGWRSNAEVRQVMSSARALILPSFAEGLPIVIMEALALGRPVISTFVAGIPELLDPECGWIVPAGSVDQIVAAMIAAIRAPASKLAEMGREGRRRVLEAHDVNSSAVILRQLFLNYAAKP